MKRLFQNIVSITLGLGIALLLLYPQVEYFVWDVSRDRYIPSNSIFKLKGFMFHHRDVNSILGETIDESGPHFRTEERTSLNQMYKTGKLFIRENKPRNVHDMDDFDIVIQSSNDENVWYVSDGVKISKHSKSAFNLDDWRSDGVKNWPQTH